MLQSISTEVLGVNTLAPASRVLAGDSTSDNDLTATPLFHLASDACMHAGIRSDAATGRCLPGSAQLLDVLCRAAAVLPKPCRRQQCVLTRLRAPHRPAITSTLGPTPRPPTSYMTTRAPDDALITVVLFTGAVFGYSMLYPYSDNLLDVIPLPSLQSRSMQFLTTMLPPVP